VMKTFGLVVPKGAGTIFEANVRRLLDGADAVAAIVLPLLESWRAVRARAAELDRQLLAVARASTNCRRLMTVPGVGAVVAASFVAAVETPENLTTSRAVGAWIGLTPRRYQSGQVDDDGPISRRGDARLRALLYEAATAMLTRVQGESELRRWGLALRKRLGFKRAAVALARKLAVVMHAMWKKGADFNPKAATSAAT
ncbi:MAG TPA: IS110 family transposase, partial [Burkholderiales bacterium]|nr:IS110 family transposase [Burkholderiales bacterium]